MMQNMDDFMDEIYEELVEVRQHLHEHPELSGKEFETQKYLKRKLKACKPDVLKKIGGTGLMVVFEGKEEGPETLFRTDIDALPIPELNKNMSYRSKFEGIAHKCGHDGHMTMMLGLAKWLHRYRPKKGKVILIFQPAEENGQGARAVLEDPAFTCDPDYVFALHNVPFFPKGSIVLREQSFSASVRSIAIRFEGKTSHAAEPEEGNCPDMAISKLLAFANAYTNNHPEKEDFCLLTPIYVTLGQKAYGTMPDKGEVHFTLRAWNPEQMERLVNDLEYEIRELALTENLQYDWSYLDIFPAVTNDVRVVKEVRQIAEQLDVDSQMKPFPFKWGEDFGFFTREFKGMMFGLGAGEDHPALHHALYDFPDDIMPTGIQLYAGIVQHFHLSS
jgi:amidohydrolase